MSNVFLASSFLPPPFQKTLSLVLARNPNGLRPLLTLFFVRWDCQSVCGGKCGRLPQVDLDAFGHRCTVSTEPSPSLNTCPPLPLEREMAGFFGLKLCP